MTASGRFRPRRSTRTTSAQQASEVRREESPLKTGALQNAILNSADFSSIATDDKGVIQLFNVGAERMLGYSATDVIIKVSELIEALNVALEFAVKDRDHVN